MSCWLWHSWEPWEDRIEKEDFIVQVRRCFKCNTIEENTVILLENEEHICDWEEWEHHKTTRIMKEGSTLPQYYMW